MRHWLSSFRRAFSGHVTRTMLFWLQKRSKSVVVFPDVHVSAARSACVAGGGSLDLGRRWAGLRYLPSEFYLADDARLEVTGDFAVYTGLHIAVGKGARLMMGSGYINSLVTIDCFESISIGNGVVISKNVTIRDSDDHRISPGGKISAPIVIEDHVWIGLNATILKGVRIGSGSVIAAGAVVTRDVPRNSLAGGVPARVLKENIAWE